MDKKELNKTPETISSTLKLGVIEVLNVLPVYYAILEQKVPVNCEVVRGKVTQLNEMLNRGEIDISVISSFEYAKNPHLYYILPDLSISADGPVRSIYLFSRKPLHELNDATINLTAFSFTSVHLIQFILQEYNIRYVKGGTEAGDGELLIADDAIRRFYEKRDPYVYDLSELWKQKTGLPFVFALWCVRREVFEKNPEKVKQLHQALLQSKKLSSRYIQQMAANRFKGIFPDEKTCARYLENLHHEFSENFQQGFNLFQQNMVKIEKLDQVAPLRFI